MSVLPPDAQRLRAILRRLDQQNAENETVGLYLRLQRDAVFDALTRAEDHSAQQSVPPPKHRPAALRGFATRAWAEGNRLRCGTAAEGDRARASPHPHRRLPERRPDAPDHCAGRPRGTARPHGAGLRILPPGHRTWDRCGLSGAGCRLSHASLGECGPSAQGRAETSGARSERRVRVLVSDSDVSVGGNPEPVFSDLLGEGARVCAVTDGREVLPELGEVADASS